MRNKLRFPLSIFLAVFLSSCAVPSSWFDSGKPEPKTPITASAYKNKTEYSRDHAVEYMTQKLIFYFTVHQDGDKPVQLKMDLQSPEKSLAEKVIRNLRQERIIVPDGVYQYVLFSRMKDGNQWEVTVKPDDPKISAFSKTVVISNDGKDRK